LGFSREGGGIPMNWLNISYASAIAAGISLLLGIISKIVGSTILWTGPRGFLTFAIACLIFAIYCCFVYMIKKREKG
jgi:hypothetical protein